MDKKIDKDNLMNQLYDYLTEEIREHYKVKDYLSKELSQYQKEKDLMVKDVSDQNRIYKIRKVFSPLNFQEEQQEADPMIDTSKLDAGIKEKKKLIHGEDEKIQMLSGYLKGLEENYFISSCEGSGEDEAIPFLSAFYKLMKTVKIVHPEIRINYKETEDFSDVMLNLSFLKGFYAFLKFVIEEVGIYVINTEIYIDKDKVLIRFQMKPKIPGDIAIFKNKRYALEKELTKEFSIVRWKTNSVIVQALMD
ncbi:MAG TPA: hypothetical protein H9735_08670 [Candidatus Anaerostipes excrementavium]|uniref:Uncharacterized protein n=1 Tax=Candidatus Anaerostipes excrementavium TaxID=2838463 RepID=A0A9D2B9P0_9FIRM|nr:hypothetical protein [uncultured Anaerostipes sp.]HIX68171.1 hypothetical protein [Candidatus Anaerostipes excrementavium]